MITCSTITKTATKNVLILILLFIVGCQNHDMQPLSIKVEMALKDAYHEFNIDEFSLLIASNGKIERQVNAMYSTNEIQSFQNIDKNFAAPIFLDLLFKKGIVDENALLNPVFSGIENRSIVAKDLICIPNYPYDPALLHSEDRVWMINNLYRMSTKNKAGCSKLDQFMIQEMGLTKDDGVTKTFLRNLWKVSQYFDSHNMEYADPGSNVSNLFPTWYAKNLKSFFGWNVFRYQKQAVLWNCFVQGDETLLLMKFMQHNIFIATCYKSKDIASPFYNNKTDLLQSPIALAIIRSLFATSKVKPYATFHLKDMIAHARFYSKTGFQNKAKKLYETYSTIIKDSIYSKYINEAPIGQIDYISDNLNTSEPFHIEKDTTVQIFAGGQAVRCDIAEEDSYKSDNIQIFLNTTPDNSNRITEKNQLFQFSYRYNKIAGSSSENPATKWLKETNIKYAFSDPSDTSYTLEVCIPWNEIKGAVPHVGKAMGANIFIGDSDLDENVRKSLLSWSVEKDEGWNDARRFGTLALVNRALPDDWKVINSQRIWQSPVIDGIEDKLWDRAGYSTIEHVYQGSVTNAEKKSKYKTLWDNKNLYFLFQIIDDFKNITGLMMQDKCWIENKNGEIVWKLQPDTTQNLSSFGVQRKMRLKAGDYFLRYTSDKRHSFEGWYVAPPVNGVYGIQIYHAKQ